MNPLVQAIDERIKAWKEVPDGAGHWPIQTLLELKQLVIAEETRIVKELEKEWEICPNGAYGTGMWAAYERAIKIVRGE